MSITLNALSFASPGHLGYVGLVFAFFFILWKITKKVRHKKMGDAYKTTRLASKIPSKENKTTH